MQPSFNNAINTPPAFTFVLNDAGETKALRPVMETLDRVGMNYDILATGTAQRLLAGNAHLAPTPEDIVTLSQSNPNLVASAQQRLNHAMNAKCCVTGLATPWQKQWADFFKQTGRRVVGYYDGFTVNANPLLNAANNFKNSLTNLITSSRDTAASLYQQGFNTIPVSAIGQPILEDVFANGNPGLLAQQLGINPNQPTILFVGDYGPGYAESFATFCQAANQMKGVNVLACLHPSVDGNLERQLIAQHNPQGNIKLISKEVRSVDLFPVSQTVISHRSMGIQALLQGKKLIIVGGKESPTEFDPVKAYHLAPQCETPQQLYTAVAQSFSTFTPPPPSKDQILNVLGIPTQAVSNIVNYLISLVAQPTPFFR